MEPSPRNRKRKSTNPKKFKPEKEISQIMSNQTDVAMTLTTYILQNNSTSNVVISPLSVQLVLGLIAAGSEGETLKQLLYFLKADSTEELNSLASHVVQNVFSGGPGPATLSLANGVWIDKSLSFQPFFTKVVDHLYKAASDVVDFQNKASEAAGKVNSWIEKETNGFVKDTVPPHLFDYQTKIVFANAIYFKGLWADPFYVWQTKISDFHLLSDGSVQVPFMSKGLGYSVISAYDGFKVLRLPYMDTRQISMYIFLPDAKDGLPSLVDKLASENGFVERHIPNQSQVHGKFQIPKFKVSFGFEATEALKEFGVRAPFIPGGLDKMVHSDKNELLYVSNIFQKSSIEINEAGTEASSSSRIEMRGCGCPPVRIEFVADHPFLFFIREDRTGVVLFVGQVLNPLAA